MERINALVVGGQRMGKSYLIEKYLIEYARGGGCSVVYNPGRPADFAGFTEVEIVSIEEYRQLWERKNKRTMKQFELPKKIEWFRIKGGAALYHLSVFSAMFKKRCVKIERIVSNARSEAFFFNSVYSYFYNTFIVFDDCRTMFSHGLSAEMIGLMSRINHAGKTIAPDPKLIGVDFALIFHGFKAVNPEAYNHINLVIQFKTMFAPIMPNDAEEIEPTIVDNYGQLKTSKKYSHFEYYIHEQENIFFEP